jgi:hypothetical protein
MHKVLTGDAATFTSQCHAATAGQLFVPVISAPNVPNINSNAVEGMEQAVRSALRTHCT